MLNKFYSYHIARNIGGRKHWQIWRIDLWFTKLFPANVLQIHKIDLTWSIWFNTRFVLTWLRVVVPVFWSILNQSVESGHRYPWLPKPFLIWVVCWAKGFQLKPNHHQLGHRKLYIYEPRVYCTFTREFTSGHGLMCTVMIMLGSRYPLQCFASCFDILEHINSPPKFYSQPASCIRWP